MIHAQARIQIVFVFIGLPFYCLTGATEYWKNGMMGFQYSIIPIFHCFSPHIHLFCPLTAFTALAISRLKSPKASLSAATDASVDDPVGWRVIPDSPVRIGILLLLLVSRISQRVDNCTSP